MNKNNKLKNILEKEAEKFIKESKNRIPRLLESATLSLLGLEKRYDNCYEIDHCNGRNSVLIDAFRKIAQSEAEKIARTYKPSTADIAGFAIAFEKEYKNQIGYAIREQASIRAKKDVQEHIDKIKLDVEKMFDEVN